MKTQKVFCAVCNGESTVEPLDEVETSKPFQRVGGGQNLTMVALITHRCMVCGTKGPVLQFKGGPTLVDPNSKAKEMSDRN